MKYFTRLALATALIMMPVFASADTNSDLAAQAQALLNQVAALQAQLSGQGSVTTTSTGSPVVTSSAACPLIGRVLKLGSSGDDVSRLQSFLASNPSIYPEAQITGYYGALTEAAVKRWQVKYNIVGVGTAETTGYGVTGPRTAAAISLQCSTSSGGGTGAGVNYTTSTPVGGFIQVSPVAGNAPLTVSVKETINTTNSCAASTYGLSWGDGTVAQSLTVPSGNCSQIVQNYSHQYLYGGVYTIVLSAGTHQTSATVVVSGQSAPAVVNVPVTQLSASPLSGNAPLAVTFSSVGSSIDFGDGSVASGAAGSSVSHTYTQSGTFTVRSGSSQITITVTAPPYTYGPLAVTPNVSGNPLTVTASFDLQTACTGYDLAWGDTSAHLSQSNSTSCASGVVTKTYTHTYSSGGSYTIYLRRGSDLSQGDSVSLVISN
jgi:hypothetical protein